MHGRADITSAARPPPHLKEGGGSVRDDAVALHLSKAQAAVACAALHRLPRQDLDGAAAPEEVKGQEGRV